MKFILNVDPQNLIVAVRAATWLHAHKSQKDATLSYGEGTTDLVMFVRRNKSGSISVFQEGLSGETQ